MIAQTRVKLIAALKKAAYLMRKNGLIKNIAGIICRQLQEEQMVFNIIFHPP